MFKATNQLFSQTKPNITVHDSNGRILTNNLMKVRRSSEWFQSQFSQPTGQALTCEDIPKGPSLIPSQILKSKMPSIALTTTMLVVRMKLQVNF